MSVYFVSAPELGRVKIGFAADPRTRLGKLRADSPTRLVLLAVIDGDVETEKDLHSRFSNFRLHGEWFTLDGALQEFVDSLKPYEPPARKRLCTDVASAVNISMSYASQILSGKRNPPWPLLISIYRKAGWKHPRLQKFSEQEIDQFEHILAKKAA